MNTEAVQMQYTLFDIWNIGTAYRHLCTAIGKLAEPQRDVTHHIGIRATAITFIHAVEVVFHLRTVYGNTYRQMLSVFLDILLHLIGMVIDAIGRE